MLPARRASVAFSYRLLKSSAPPNIVCDMQQVFRWSNCTWLIQLVPCKPHFESGTLWIDASLVDLILLENAHKNLPTYICLCLGPTEGFQNPPRVIFGLHLCFRGSAEKIRFLHISADVSTYCQKRKLYFFCGELEIRCKLRATREDFEKCPSLRDMGVCTWSIRATRAAN